MQQLQTTRRMVRVRRLAQQLSRLVQAQVQTQVLQAQEQARQQWKRGLEAGVHPRQPQSLLPRPAPLPPDLGLAGQVQLEPQHYFLALAPEGEAVVRV